MGESAFTEAHHGDLVGEIANTLSGRARRHFGDGLNIAPPRLLVRPAEAASRIVPYAIPLRWHGYDADLIIQMAGARED